MLAPPAASPCCLQRGISPSLQTCFLPQDSYVIMLSHSPLGRTARWENHLLFSRVSDLQCELEVWLPPIIWHSARPTPPPTHAVFAFLSPGSVLSHHKKSSTGYNMQWTPTVVNVINPLPSSSLTTYRACPHFALRLGVACFDVFQHLPPNYFNRLPRPCWQIFFLQFTVSALFGNKSRCIPWDNVDPPVHLHRPVISVTEKPMHLAIVNMFFLYRPYVTGNSGHWTRTHKNCYDSFSLGSSLTRRSG